MTKSDLTIVFDEKGGADAQLVRERLDMYNVGVDRRFDLLSDAFLREERASARPWAVSWAASGAAGCTSSFLWIDEPVRGQDWGTRLMDQAEAYARERGCHSVTLDTHSFQARPFYEGRGYEVFGTLDDYPKGHKKFFLRKKL